MRHIHKAYYINKQEFSPATAACYLTCPSKGFEVKSTWPGLMSRLKTGNNPHRTKVPPDLMFSKTNYVLHNASNAYNPKELYKPFEFQKTKLIKHYSDAIIVYFKT
jgi:hypothetical protein